LPSEKNKAGNNAGLVLSTLAVASLVGPDLPDQASSRIADNVAGLSMITWLPRIAFPLLNRT
jgi:hypothetical protein